MKTPKRPSPYDEQPDPMRDLDMDFESQDDEIIDLEDIIEMPSRPIDEDEDLDLDLDVEILDIDSDLESEPEPARKGAQPFMSDSAQMRSEARDLLDSFGDEGEEDESLFEPVTSREPAVKSKEKVEFPEFDEDEKSLLDEFMDEAIVPESMMEEKVELRERAVSALRVTDEIRSATPEPTISSETFEPEQPAPAVQTPIPPAADITKTAEELIGRLESRLQDHIRVLVESKLPELVRSIISEEIEKLKKEL